MTKLVWETLPRDLGMFIVFSSYFAGGLSQSFFRSPKRLSHFMIFSPTSASRINICLIKFLANSALVIACFGWLNFAAPKLAFGADESSKKCKWKIHQAHCDGYCTASLDSTSTIVSLTMSLWWPKRERRICRAVATLKLSSFSSSYRMYI